MKHNLISLLGISLAAGTAAFADENPICETTLVTAARTEQTIDDSLAPVTVFNREDIERLQAKSLNELLTRVPGIALSTSGSLGSTTSIYVRGTNSSHTLFLIDGQRVNSATTGDADFQAIDPDMIDRIEVVRGPRSSLYGSDAIGGVIQIFTKKGNTHPGHYARVGAGSHDTTQVAMGSREQLHDFYYAVNVAYLETNGFNSTKINTPPSYDNDMHRKSSAQFNLGYSSENIGNVDLSHFHTEAKSDYDNSWGGQPFGKSWIQTTRLAYTSPEIGIWKTHVSVGRAIDDFDSFDDLDSTSHYHYRTIRDSASWVNDFKLTATQQFTLGYDYYQDNIDAGTEYVDTEGKPVDARDRNAIFGLYLATFGDVDLQLGLRDDDDEDFGTETTANAAVGYAIDKHHKIIVAYGEGFKAPSFNDLYYLDQWGSFGNPNLEAETSENYEIEFRGNYHTLSWTLSYYETDISNLIIWQEVAPNSYMYTPVNVNDAEIKGIELSAQTSVMNWILQAAVNYLEAEDAVTGNELVNRPGETLSIDADHSFGDWKLGFTFQASSSRFSDEDNTNAMAGYGTINARISYDITEALKAQLKLNNLFDKNYQVRDGYNTDGFNTFVTLTYAL